MGFFRVTIYGIIAAVYVYTLVYDFRVLPRIGSQWWIYKLTMLSMINLVVQAIYAINCLICAVFDWHVEKTHAKEFGKKSAHTPSYWRQTRLHRVCDFTYSTCVFPLGMATCLLFWSMYAVDPSLVMPKEWARFVPAFHNHVTHTAPVAFLLIDTLLTCHHAPGRATGSMVVVGLFGFYLSIIFGVRFSQGFWLYPIFEKLAKQQIALFLAVAGTMFWFLYLIGDGLNSMLWGPAPHAPQKVSPKQQ